MNPPASGFNNTYQRPIKVMIIDDSAVIRGLVGRWINAEPDFEVVGYGVNGLDGINRARNAQPDIIILDVEMPQMDGLTALPELLKVVPGVRVIMASTLTKSGGEVTIKALSLGATDYIPKPDAGKSAGATEYKNELFRKIRGLGIRKTFPKPAPNIIRQPLRPSNNMKPLNKSVPATPNSNIPPATHNVNIAPAVGGWIASDSLTSDQYKLIPPKRNAHIEALFIGSSTGGPEALNIVVQGLTGKINVPIFMTQHMPVLFTKILAEHLSRQTGANVVEAEENMQPKPGTFYIAPGGKHMIIVKNGFDVRIALNEKPPENFCRPSVDPLFRSAAQVYGDHALGVILTGMGHDGRDGAKIMTEKGAMIIAQDEQSSVVWGMPGAVAQAGLATYIKPIDEIAPTIINVIRGVSV